MQQQPNEPIQVRHRQLLPVRPVPGLLSAQPQRLLSGDDQLSLQVMGRRPTDRAESPPGQLDVTTPQISETGNESHGSQSGHAKGAPTVISAGRRPERGGCGQQLRRDGGFWRQLQDAAAAAAGDSCGCTDSRRARPDRAGLRLPSTISAPQLELAAPRALKTTVAWWIPFTGALNAAPLCFICGIL